MEECSTVADYLVAKTKREGYVWSAQTEKAFDAIRMAEAGDWSLLHALLDFYVRSDSYPVHFPEQKR